MRDTWYRRDQDRARSVYRRANPWYRRLARAVIGLSLVAGAAVALTLGAIAVRDRLDPARLPPAGAETPVIRSTSFEIRSTAPSPILDGTLTLDTVTGAFEYVGRGSGPDAGVQVLSTDGTTLLIRRGDGPLEPAGSADRAAADVDRAISYLIDDRSIDAIITGPLRNGYVDVQDRTEVGDTDSRVVRYALSIDTATFAEADPQSFAAFRERAIPAAQVLRALPITVTIDAANVLTSVDDIASNWSWQRLAYSDRPFVPDPDNAGRDLTITTTDGNIGDG